MSRPLTDTLLRTTLLREYRTFHSGDRIGLVETFEQRPVLAADLDPAAFSQAANRLIMGANRNFTIAGTNMVDANSSLDSAGGCTLVLAGASGDQGILQPAASINAVAQTGFRAISWLTQKEVHFQACLQIQSLATTRFAAGIKLTSTAAIATDNDQAMFHYDTASGVSATNWRMISRNNGGTNNDVAVATNKGGVPVAITDVLVDIHIDSLRYPHFYLNGALVGAGVQLKNAVSLMPFFSMQALAVLDTGFSVRWVMMSRKR